MAVIGKVAAVFTANSSGLTSGVSRAAASMKRLESAAGSLRSGMRALVAIQGAQFFGGIVQSAGGYVQSLVRMGQAQADVIDKQSKLAARLGMTYGEFSGLALAGDLAGVGMDAIAAAATKADVAFVKAVNGSATARAAFDGLGLSLDDLGRMSAAERFQAISQAIAELPTEAQRAAAAVQLFGRAGAQLLPLFSGGAAGIADAANQAQRLGLALTTAQGRDVEAMNDAFTLAGQAIQGVIGQVTAYLAPAIKSIADTFTNFIGTIGGANIGRAIGDGILQGARFLAGIGDYLITNLGGVFTYLSSVGAQWGMVADFFNRMGHFLSGVFYSAQAGLGFFILGLGGIVEGLATVGKELAGYLGFDTSGIDVFLAGAEAFNQSISDGITESINNASDGFSNAFGEAKPVGQAMAGPLTTALDAAIAQAEASASAVEQSGAGIARQVGEEIAQAVEPRQLKGIDSRSSEGVAEMFRLMRGGTRGVQEEQLAVLEQIAANTAGAGEDLMEVAF